jgi:manganese efflux pump family protein
MAALLLALALAMDATAVAAARSVAGMGRRDGLRLALSFGAFQSGMSGLGWALGASAARWIESWDHWVAFGLLALIGGRMLVEALRGEPEEEARTNEPLGLHTLLMLSVATSIDALAAGVTLPLLEISGAVAIALIGLVTFVLSLVGAAGGRLIGERGGRLLEALGGLVLIALGVVSGFRF